MVGAEAPSHLRPLPLTSAESQIALPGNPCSERDLSIPLSSPNRGSPPPRRGGLGSAAASCVPCLGHFPPQGVRQKRRRPAGWPASRAPRRDRVGCSVCCCRACAQVGVPGRELRKEGNQSACIHAEDPPLKASTQTHSSDECASLQNRQLDY